MGFHTVLDQPRVLPQLVGGVGVHLEDPDAQQLALRVLHLPDLLDTGVLLLLGGIDLGEAARRGHPVQWLVGAVVGVDTDRTIGLDHHQTVGLREVGGESTFVVDGTTADHQTHG